MELNMGLLDAAQHPPFSAYFAYFEKTKTGL
jgi:hypothetical protein